MDDFKNPRPHKAASKATVDSVIGGVIKTGNSLMSLLSGLLAAALILYSSIVLYDTFYTQASASTAYGYLLEEPVIIEEGGVPLSEAMLAGAISANYRAWLTMYDTNIDYPVMQGKDDYYYASHDIYDNVSLTGAIYMAAGNSEDLSDDYNIIYGHHMDNKAMFGGLDEYKDKEYFESHREGTLVAESGTYDLYTFAVVSTDAYETRLYTPGNRKAKVLGFLNKMRASSDGKTQILIFDEKALEGAEKIAALSTCAGANTNGRLMVFATLTKRNMLLLNASGYEGIYDNMVHGPSNIEVNYEDGTSFSYSVDDGKTWIPGLPEIKNAGESEVMIRAENEVYGEATAKISLKVDPKPAIVRVSDSYKFFGEEDPQWETDSIEGIIDGFVPTYSIERTNADETIGVYPDVLSAEGEKLQGNYTITYVPGTFTIVSGGSLAITAEGYTGVYDAQSHGLGALSVNVEAGTVIEYSIDGGSTWTKNAPSITNVGTINVLIRATNPGYAQATAEAVLTVTPAPVTVKADDASKEAGEDDPQFIASVSGVIDDYAIAYRISRPGEGKDEESGFYAGAIVPFGDEIQGNYRVTYVAGDFTITDSENIIDDPKVPLIDHLEPKNGRGTPAWALVNLICTIITVYMFLPLLHLRAKYGRSKDMKDYNSEKCEMMDAEDLSEEEETERECIFDFAVEEKQKNSEEKITREDISKEDFASAVEELYYRIKKFVRRFRAGFGIEVLASAAAVIAFILTEDMRLPMVLIDKWTLIMILIMAICWFADVRLMRYRDGMKIDELKEEKEQENIA